MRLFSMVAVVARVVGVKVFVFVAVSTLVLATILVLVASYSLFIININEYIAFPRLNNTVVVSGFALSPLSSLIKIDDVEKALNGTPGIRAIVYEVVTLAYVNDEVIVVRSLKARDLKMITDYVVLAGIDVYDYCTNCVWVGMDLARKLNINVGNILVLQSLFSKEPLVARVAGILLVDKPYSNEIIVSWMLGTRLRGVGDEYASIALVLLEPDVNKSLILEKLGISDVREQLLEKALLVLKYIGRSRRTLLYTSPDFYFARLGLPRELLLALALSIVFILSSGYYVLGQLPLVISREKLRLLYEIGLSETRIKLSIALIVAFITLSVLPLSSILSKIVLAAGNVAILGYDVEVNLDTLTLSMISAYMLLFMMLGLLMVSISGENS